MNNDSKTGNGGQAQDESLNTGSSSANNNHEGQYKEGGHNKEGIHNNALYAASMGTAATASVNPHDSSGLEQTGTNPGYEGAIGEGAGGSMGTGYTSGQSGAGATISTNDDYDKAGIGSTGKEDDRRQQADDAADETGE